MCYLKFIILNNMHIYIFFPEVPCSEMRRIHTNGIYQTLYQLPNVQRIRVLYIYDLPHPVYKSSLPQHGK